LKIPKIEEKTPGNRGFLVSEGVLGELFLGCLMTVPRQIVGGQSGIIKMSVLPYNSTRFH